MDAASDGGVGVSRFARLLDWARRADSLPYSVIVGLAVAASLVKSGFAGWNLFGMYPHLLVQWGNPSDPFQSNLLNNAVGTLLLALTGDPASPALMLVEMAVTGMVILLLAVLLRRSLTQRQASLAFVAVMASGIASVLWREIGRYDAWTLLGVTLLVLGRSRCAYIAGAAVASLAAPEQALVTGLILVVGAVILGSASARARGLLLISVAALVNVAVAVWFGVLGDPFATRLGNMFFQLAKGESFGAATVNVEGGFGEAVRTQVLGALTGGYSYFWSLAGASLLLILAGGALRADWRRVYGATLAMYVMAYLASFAFGKDRTRDLVLLGSALLLVLIRDGAVAVAGPRRVPNKVSLLLTWLLIAIMVIAPMTYFFWTFEEPWRYFVLNLRSIVEGDWAGWDYSFR